MNRSPLPSNWTTAARGSRVYELRDDVRALIPLALTPAGRAEYLEWYLTYGRHECAADPISVIWSLFEIAASPDQGLATTFLNQPAWQAAVPHGLTRFGWDSLKPWVSSTYRLRGRWLRDARLVPRYTPYEELELLLIARPELAASFPGDSVNNCKPEPVLQWVRSLRLPGIDTAWESTLAGQIRGGIATRMGVNVVGLFRYPSGLQRAASVMVDTLRGEDIRIAMRDVPVPTTRDHRSRSGFDGVEQFPITILSTGLDISAADAYRMAGLHRRPGVYRVAVWWWELEALPLEWLDRGRDIDEIWAPTRFIAAALQILGKPVHLMPPAVKLPAFTPLPKIQVGLDPTKFSFLFIFDMNSRLPRKNPIGLIRAFRAAFQSHEAVELAIKVSTREAVYPEWWAELDSAAAAAGVTIIDKALSQNDLLALIDAADAYVSLHRSEGFGLTLAEAMLLGKPTVGTRYSGNLDFMTDANSYLVDYQLVPVDAPGVAAPPGALWAEPSIEHAAAIMREIVDNPEEAARRGVRAREDLTMQLSLATAGERMAARLRAIREERA